MTDNEIVKALAYCRSRNCVECPRLQNNISEERDCRLDLMYLCYDLINRQKAEIERLKYNLKAVLDERADHSEAIREFAERLKEKAYIQKPYGTTQIVDVYQIDNLVKKMTE